MSVSAPAAPGFSRGQHRSRLRWPILVGVFVAVLAVVIGVAAVVMNLAAPAPPKKCLRPPCEGPPTPPQPPKPLAPALITRTLFKSTLGYQVEYERGMFSLERRGPRVQIFSPKFADALYIVQGFPPASGTPSQILERISSDLPLRLVGVAEDTDPESRVLGPAVGYRSGVARQFVGALDTPQGPGAKVNVVVVVAGDAEATVALIVAAAAGDRDGAFQFADRLMNTFRFPTEIPE